MKNNLYKKYLKMLPEFVSFKSISTDVQFKKDILETVAWLKNTLEDSQFKVKILKGKDCNPLVFASFLVSSKLPTVLIYGHYDVQPADISDGWKSNPFSLAKGKNKLFARGVVDNKGQILIHIAAIKELIKLKKLKFNVKFLIEGNEETGNIDMPEIIFKNKKLLASDLMLISDGELTNNKPTIEVSLRGGFNCTLRIKTAKNNLHSGIFGGAVPNAGQEITAFLSKLFATDNTIKFDKFYEDCDLISKEELLNNKNLSTDKKKLLKLAGVKKLVGEKGYDFYTLTGLRPTIQITGLKCGYIDSGYANIVPSEALVKLNFRLIASQDAAKIAKIFKQFVKDNLPKYVSYDLTFFGLHNPVKINTKNNYVKICESLLKEVYGSSVARKNVGGAIPVVADVKKILKKDTLLIPFCNEDCNMHGANENFDIALIQKGLEFSFKFFSREYSYHWKKGKGGEKY